MSFALALMWPQPLAPLHSLGLSSLVAAIPLVLVMVLMGVLRKSGLFVSACGLLTAWLLAILIWRMPLGLAVWSVMYGFMYAIMPILWIVFAALWLYNVTVETGNFDLLRRWMERHASGDRCVQVVLVAFCFGALLEGCAGFGAPVAVTAFLLVGLGVSTRQAVVVALIANTAPVAFGAMGTPIVALAGVTGLDLFRLSAMVGRQLPFLSLLLPCYLCWAVGGFQGVKRAWPAALVAGSSYAVAQFLVSNFWGPYAADIIAALASIAALIAFLRVWGPRRADEFASSEQSATAVGAPQARQLPLASRAAFAGWLPWALLSLIIVVWSYLKLTEKGQIRFPIPVLHNSILITLYQRPYAALYSFQPLAIGTAIFTAAALTALCLKVRPKAFLRSGHKALCQLRLPGLTVILIVGVAYLYNYSGMAYTLGAAVAQVGSIFPLVSSYLGWIACFLSGSDSASNLLFGNLQVAAAHQLHLNPILLAATNSSGGVAGKMISLQNITVGLTTVGLTGEEGRVLRSTFWHSVFLAALIGLLAYAQAYWVPGMVPLNPN
jgi:lactate permease